MLIDQVEEKSNANQDYYLNQVTIDMLEEQGADSQLIALLQKILGK